MVIYILSWDDELFQKVSFSEDINIYREVMDYEF
jgi:hypothetical protein